MAKRSRAKRSVIEISSSSEHENGDAEEEDEENSEESEPLSESNDDFDATSTDNFDSSALSESESDGDSEDEESSSSSGSQEHYDEDIQEEGEDSRSDRVLRLLQGGGELRKLRAGLRKLTLVEYKAYLRSNGLRLSGTKEECIERIIDVNLIMKDGNGQRQYPRSSFTINCTGDVCKGDVVLLTQKVYKNFDKMRRGGKQLGKRTIAGRIVKESYGAAKQQHTFTVEVLWSQGVKQLPPLYPLLVKGRNLYKLKTFRQRWKDEEERLEVLAEKHKRGEAARFIRATRKSRSIKPTKASSNNRGNKRQKPDHHRRPNEIMRTSNMKHNYSIDERGKAMAGSKRTKHYQRKPHPPGRLNLAKSRNSRPPMRNPNFVPAITVTSLQFNYPSANNFRHFESDSYSQRVPYSHSSNWGSARRSHLSSSSNWGSASRSHLSSYSYTLPAPEHQQYGHESSYSGYVSQSSNYPHSPGMLATHGSSSSIAFVNYECRWNS